MGRFKGKRISIIRHGAYGDVIHCSHLPRLFKEKGASFVRFEVNVKGHHILQQNPHIDELRFFNPQDSRWAGRSYEWLKRRIKAENEDCDIVIDLGNSLERGYIAMEDMPEYYMSTEHRRDKYGSKNYYDIMNELCGLEERGVTGEMYFSQEETNTIEEYLNKYEGKTKILINLSGSLSQKVFVKWQEVVSDILAEYEDAIVWLTGDEECKTEIQKSMFASHDRVRNLAGKWKFRQVMCFAKYVNLVISPESGLAVAANAFNTPTIQMMTAANIQNHSIYAKNDYSIQSTAPCSPCHKGPYEFLGCPKKDNLPICTHFEADRVMTQVRKALVNERIAV